ncbi:MAG TPA: hypothetical protein VM512_06530 [Burkholderiaceae bacterium]|jgi:hypothetical protein|nr:hypothetical protein [Burkholderiaceae bacterium]
MATPPGKRDTPPPEDPAIRRPAPPYPREANVPDDNGEPPSVKRGDDPLWSEPPVENE